MPAAPPPRAPGGIAYSPAQQRIIAHRGSHLQVVACAGSGKTETVSVRVTSLIEESVPPAGIVAFTFTNAAAEALKTRILRKVRELERPEVFAEYHATLRHLIVDEFQDINPAQARLISLLGKPPVQVCVVGDDDQYLADYADDLDRIWQVERPFELHLPEANVTGRADVILDKEGGELGALALVDYKTKPDPAEDPVHALQLQIYTAAGRGEGYDVRAAYVHDLTAPKPAARTSLPVGPVEVEGAKATASTLARGIRDKSFGPNVGPHCKRCDVRLICRHG